MHKPLPTPREFTEECHTTILTLLSTPDQAGEEMTFRNDKPLSTITRKPTLDVESKIGGEKILVGSTPIKDAAATNVKRANFSSVGGR